MPLASLERERLRSIIDRSQDMAKQLAANGQPLLARAAAENANDARSVLNYDNWQRRVGEAHSTSAAAGR